MNKLKHSTKAICIICTFKKWFMPIDVIGYILSIPVVNTKFNYDGSFIVDENLFIQYNKNEEFKFALAGVRYSFSDAKINQRIIFYSNGTVIRHNLHLTKQLYDDTNGVSKLGPIRNVLRICFSRLIILTTDQNLFYWNLLADLNHDPEFGLIANGIQTIQMIQNKVVMTNNNGDKIRLEHNDGELFDQMPYKTLSLPLEVYSINSFPRNLKIIGDSDSYYKCHLVQDIVPLISCTGVTKPFALWLSNDNTGHVLIENIILIYPIISEIYFLTDNGSLFRFNWMIGLLPVKILTEIESIHRENDIYAITYDGKVWTWGPYGSPTLIKFIC